MKLKLHINRTALAVASTAGIFNILFIMSIGVMAHRYYESKQPGPDSQVASQVTSGEKTASSSVNTGSTSKPAVGAPTNPSVTTAPATAAPAVAPKTNAQDQKANPPATTPVGGQSQAQNTEPAVVSPPKSVPATPSLLFFANYDAVNAGNVLTDLWQREQEPASGTNGSVQATRISVVASSQVPGSGANKPAGKAMRVELRPYANGAGDVTNTGGYLANRAEVYARHASPGSTPADKWPDPAGSTRWYSYSVFVTSDFAQDTNKWFTFTQFKGFYGGEPPLAIEIDGNEFVLGGTKIRRTLGQIQPGTWTRFVIGIRYSPNADGWVNVFMNNNEVVSKTMIGTMDTHNGTPDPVYLKQGIYRANDWQATHILFFSPLKIGYNKSDV